MAKFTDLTRFPLYYEKGYDQFGYDRDGFDRKGFTEEGYDREGNLDEKVRDKKERQAHFRSLWTGTTAWKDAGSILYGYLLWSTVFFLVATQLLRTGVSENHISAAFVMIGVSILLARKHARFSPWWVRVIAYIVALVWSLCWVGIHWGF